MSADLAVDVGPGVEQHLNHGLVTAYAGVHEGGHSLQEGRGQKEVQAGAGISKVSWGFFLYRRKVFNWIFLQMASVIPKFNLLAQKNSI